MNSFASLAPGRIWLTAIASICRPYRAMADRMWEHRSRQFLECLPEASPSCQGGLSESRKQAVRQFSGSVLATLGTELEVRGSFCQTRNGFTARATDCRLWLKRARGRQALTQSVLEIRPSDDIPNELPFFVAHARTCRLPWLIRYDSVTTGSCLDQTHRVETMFPGQVWSFFEHQPADSKAHQLIRDNQWSVECDRSRILIYRPGYLVPVQELTDFVDSGLQVAESWCQRC